jgi:hypothetical protein
MTRIFVAMTLAAALATPALGQTRQSPDPAQAWAQQSSKAKKAAKAKAVRRYAARHQVVAAKPCAVRTWIGCHGWDPDPNVRMMMQMDAHHHDD